MGLFGRGRRSRDSAEALDDEVHDADELEDSAEALDDGPFDQADAPDDGVSRLDLGSMRLPVPDGAQLQVKMNRDGFVDEILFLTLHGELKVRAYAAPRSGGLWDKSRGELAEQLRGDGVNVRSVAGEWGQELIGSLGDMAIQIVGVDGPRWMLRGSVVTTSQLAGGATVVLRDFIRGTIVVRGTGPMPPETPLPIVLPEAIAAHIAQVQNDGGA